MLLKNRILICFSLILLMFAATDRAQAEVRLSADVAIEKSRLHSADDLPVRVTLTNSGNETAYVLKQNTPFFGIAKRLFDVRRDGKPVQYQGRIENFGHPEAEDYFVLEPGESRTQLIELSSVYDTRIAGHYTVTFDSVFQNVLGEHDDLSKRNRPDDLIEVISPPATIRLDGLSPDQVPAVELAQADEAVTVGAKARAPVFRNCSASRKNTLRTALNKAENYANTSYNHLQNNPNGSSRYRRWFGSFNSSRFATVKDHFKKIRNAARNQTITFDCGCTSGSFAWVNPTRPYKINLCNAFWTAPTTGTDSKAGTIIHELSHFNVLGGTDDFVYSTGPAKRLAGNRPGRAIQNADNHEYFAENAN